MPVFRPGRDLLQRGFPRSGAPALLWTLLPRVGPFRRCTILPLGTLAALPLLPRRALGVRVAVLTVLALRPFTALIMPASLTRVRAVIAPAKTVAVAAVAVATVAIATFRPGHLLLAMWGWCRLEFGRSAVALEPTEDAIHEAR